MVLTWLPSRFHSTHQFCFTPADQKEVKQPRSPCRCPVSVWPVVAVLKLCFLADNYRQQELSFNASQSKKVLVHSGLRFGLSHSSGWEWYLLFWNLTYWQPKDSWIHTSDTIGEVLETGWLLSLFYRTQWKQSFEPLHILENYLLS